MKDNNYFENNNRTIKLDLVKKLRLKVTSYFVQIHQFEFKCKPADWQRATSFGSYCHN